MRNLEYPLDWDGIFRRVGFPAFLKPHDGGGWRNVYKVNSPEEFFAAYNESGRLCMTLQGAVRLRGVFPLLRYQSARRSTSCATIRASRTICATFRAIRRRLPRSGPHGAKMRSRSARRSATTSTRSSSRLKTACPMPSTS